MKAVYTNIHNKGHSNYCFCRCSFILFVSLYAVIYLVNIYQAPFDIAVCRQTSIKGIARAAIDDMHSEALFRSLGRSHKHGRKMDTEMKQVGLLPGSVQGKSSGTHTTILLPLASSSHVRDFMPSLGARRSIG
jgi:hypothetical protein